APRVRRRAGASSEHDRLRGQTRLARAVEGARAMRALLAAADGPIREDQVDGGPVARVALHRRLPRSALRTVDAALLVVDHFATARLVHVGEVEAAGALVGAVDVLPEPQAVDVAVREGAQSDADAARLAPGDRSSEHRERDGDDDETSTRAEKQGDTLPFGGRTLLGGRDVVLARD